MLSCNEDKLLTQVSDKEDKLLLKITSTRLSMEDEDDWRQVSDEDDDCCSLGKGLSPRLKRPQLSLKKSSYYDDQSYRFTESGSIWLDGFGKISPSPLQGQSDVPMQSRLVFISRLGEGACASVFKALDLFSFSLRAVKVISVEDRDKRRQLVQELEALRDFESCSKDDSNRLTHYFAAFSNVDNGAVGLVSEYMDGGSLQDLVDSGGCRNEQVLSSISYQCLLGLDQLHKHGKVHRDIKPANILLNSKGVVKIADFGIARALESASLLKAEQGSTQERVFESSKVLRAKTFIGTMTYMSPERISGNTYDSRADVWSLGLSVMTAALGKLPFGSTSYWSILSYIRDEDPPSLPTKNSGWSEMFQNFLSCCLTKDSNKRAYAQSLLKHPFVAKRKLTLSSATAFDHEKSVHELEVILKATNDHLKSLYLRQKEEDCDQVDSIQFSGLPKLETPFRDHRNWDHLGKQLHLNPSISREYCSSKLIWPFSNPTPAG